MALLPPPVVDAVCHYAVGVFHVRLASLRPLAGVLWAVALVGVRSSAWAPLWAALSASAAAALAFREGDGCAEEEEEGEEEEGRDVSDGGDDAAAAGATVDGADGAAGGGAGAVADSVLTVDGDDAADGTAAVDAADGMDAPPAGVVEVPGAARAPRPLAPRRRRRGEPNFPPLTEWERLAGKGRRARTRQSSSSTRTWTRTGVGVDGGATPAGRASSTRRVAKAARPGRDTHRPARIACRSRWDTAVAARHGAAIAVAAPFPRRAGRRGLRRRGRRGRRGRHG